MNKNFYLKIRHLNQIDRDQEGGGGNRKICKYEQIANESTV